MEGNQLREETSSQPQHLCNPRTEAAIVLCTAPYHIIEEYTLFNTGQICGSIKNNTRQALLYKTTY
jgi:hypothetical protein